MKVWPIVFKLQYVGERSLSIQYLHQTRLGKVKCECNVINILFQNSWWKLSTCVCHLRTKRQNHKNLTVLEVLTQNYVMENCWVILGYCKQRCLFPPFHFDNYLDKLSVYYRDIILGQNHLWSWISGIMGTKWGRKNSGILCMQQWIQGLGTITIERRAIQHKPLWVMN